MQNRIQACDHNGVPTRKSAIVTTGVMMTWCLVAFLAAGTEAVNPAPKAATTNPSVIQHRFLAVDERAQLHYVDEAAPKNNWTIATAGKYRDIQLVGSNRVMLSTTTGWVEYDLTTRAEVAKVSLPEVKKVMCARRLANGNTVVGTEDARFLEVDSNKKIIREVKFPAGLVRVARLTPDGHFLFGSNTFVMEGAPDGTVLRKHEIPGAKHIYMVLKKSDGNLLAAAGYGGFLAEVDATSTVVKKWGGAPAPAGLWYNFFAGFQVLANGNMVVATWTGHGANDSEKGQQLVEFDPSGNVVWKWHSPKTAGSIHGVIVLDGLDVNVLCDDRNLVLGVVK